jgi:hypothetical protein
VQSFTLLGQFTERVALALRRWNQICDIPTPRFNQVLDALRDDGWTVSYEYDGYDAWIDYGRLDLQSGDTKLRFAWTNYTEGEISGPRSTLETVASRFGLCDSTGKSGRWLT